MNNILLSIRKFVTGEGLGIENATARKTVAIILTLIILGLWVNMVLRASRGHGSQYNDFTEFSRDLVFRQINIYDAYSFEVTSIGKYPPFFAAVFAPLVPMPLVIGATLWFWINFALIIVSSRVLIRFIWRFSGEKLPARIVHLWTVPLVLTSVVVITNLETSQVNIFIFALVLFALDYFSRHKDYAAGLLLGVATAIKLTPGLFIAYFAYKRSWKVVAWAVAGIIICWGVILPFLLGFDRYLTIMQSWLGILSTFITEGTHAEGGFSGFRDTNQSLSAAVRRYLTATPANDYGFYVNLFSIPFGVANTLINILKLAMIVFMGWVFRKPVRDRTDPKLPYELALVAIATLFISPVSWINHYIVMILPFAAIFYYIRAGIAAGRIPENIYRMLLISVFLLSMIHPFFLAFSLPFFGAIVISVALLKAHRSAIIPHKKISGA